MRDDNKTLITFFLFFSILTTLPYGLIIHSGHIDAAEGHLATLLMWSPAFAALATCKLRNISLGELGWKWQPSQYVALAYILPVLYALPVYALTWMLVSGAYVPQEFVKESATSFGFPHWPRLAAFALSVPAFATGGVIRSMANALGEEIGWRGFLLPRLVRRLGFTGGCFVTGCIHALWHVPAMLWTDYNAGTGWAYTLTCFFVMVISFSFVTGWLRLRSGSLWPAAMLHASHNLFIQGIFDPMTATTGAAPYITSEFGWGLALTIGILALIAWSNRNKLAGSPWMNVQQGVTSVQALPA